MQQWWKGRLIRSPIHHFSFSVMSQTHILVIPPHQSNLRKDITLYVPIEPITNFRNEHVTDLLKAIRSVVKVIELVGSSNKS